MSSPALEWTDKETVIENPYDYLKTDPDESVSNIHAEISCRSDRQCFPGMMDRASAWFLGKTYVPKRSNGSQ